MKATQYTECAVVMDTTVACLHSQFNRGAQWRGLDAQQFRSEWDGASSRALATPARVVRSVADEWYGAAANNSPFADSNESMKKAKGMVAVVAE